MKLKRIFLVLVPLSLMIFSNTSVFAAEMKNKNIRFTYDKGGISGLASPKDPFNATVTNPQQPLSLTLQYKTDNSDFQELNLSQGQMQALPDEGIIKYTYADNQAPLKVVKTFRC